MFIANFYKNIHSLIVIPSHSLSLKFKKSIPTGVHTKWKNAPLIFDAITPDYLEISESSSILLHSFLGSTSITCLIELLHAYSLKKIIFLGSCSKILSDCSQFSNNDTATIRYPKYFKLHACANSINWNNWGKDEYIHGSTYLPTFLDNENIAKFLNDHGVETIDMEAAFIAEAAYKRGIKFFCGLAITDYTLLTTDSFPSLQKITQVADYTAIFKRIYEEISSNGPDM